MKLFYGWVIVAVGIVVGCIGMGGLMSFGVFLQPMANSLGWSRAGISTGSTLGFLSMGVGGFLWGRLFDRYGARVVVMLGGLLQGLGLVAASQAQSLPVFLAAYGAVVGLAVGAFYVPLTAATASWFTRHRSLAVSLVSAGLALGTTLMAPLARWLIVTHDWRFAMLTLGLIAWAVILPAALLLRPAPVLDGGSNTHRIRHSYIPGRHDFGAGVENAGVLEPGLGEFRLLRCSLRTDLPYGFLCRGLRGGAAYGRHGARRGGASGAVGPHHLRIAG